MKKQTKYIFLTTLILILSMTTIVFAQSETFSIRITKDWGYAGFSGDIQGRFSLKASGNDDLVSVTYLFDDQPVATLTEPPFRYQFVTSAYDIGIHNIQAKGILADGTNVLSNTMIRNFLSKETSGDMLKNLLIPILSITVIISILGVMIPAFLNKGKKFQVGIYSSKGGTVCKQCHLPFSRHYFSPNMGIGKLERCPHCGKIQITLPTNSDKLKLAEERYTQANQENLPSMDNPEAKLKKMIEDSKFDN